MQNQIHLAPIIFGSILIAAALIYFEKWKMKRNKIKRDGFFEERGKYSREEFIKDFAALGFSEEIVDSLEPVSKGRSVVSC
jgi:hypothetical protein